MQNTIGQQPQTVQVPNYSGVNIQIFNPAVNAGATNPIQPPVVQQTQDTQPAQPCCYPPGYYTTTYGPQQTSPVTNNTTNNNTTNNTTNNTAPTNADNSGKKTEKRNIVELTDDYLKTVETYLNDPDPKVRLMGAKEVGARLTEDDSRKKDPALNALVNKMLQDPSEPVKFTALAVLNSRIATGDNLTKQLLQGIQNDKKSGHGQDCEMASQILLKMSGNEVEKEFEVKKAPKETEKKVNK